MVPAIRWCSRGLFRSFTSSSSQLTRRTTRFSRAAMVHLTNVCVWWPAVYRFWLVRIHALFHARAQPALPSRFPVQLHNAETMIPHQPVGFPGGASTADTCYPLLWLCGFVAEWCMAGFLFGSDEAEQSMPCLTT